MSPDEENARLKYADFFDIKTHDLDRDVAQTGLEQAVVIREITRGIVPQLKQINDPNGSTT